MEERNKTHKKKTIAEKKEISPWFAVAAAFIIGIGGGFVLCDWWTGRRRK
jgi:putative flippase GtrA